MPLDTILGGGILGDSGISEEQETPPPEEEELAMIYGSYNNILEDRNGAIISGATVTVFNTGTSVIASIFSDQIGTPKPNPFVTDNLGTVVFYAANGFYDTNITKSGYGQVNFTVNVQVQANSNSVSNFSSLTSAVNAIGANQYTLLIDVPTTCTGDTIVPSNIALQFQYPGSINQGTYALTVNGPMDAGLWQIFTGTGNVTLALIEQALPEWFGN